MSVAVLASAAVQVALLHRAHYLGVWQVTLLPAAAAALIGVVLAHFSRGSLIVALAVLLVPDRIRGEHVEAPGAGDVPAAGPHAVAGNGGAALSSDQLATDER